MLFVNRNSVEAPKVLVSDRAARAKEFLRPLFLEDDPTVAQRRVEMSAFTIHDPTLDDALHELFHGKCAFCEASKRLTDYRFRPTEEAGPTHSAPPGDDHRAHLYYTWLANAWQNIYLICDDCMPREASIFPVKGRRTPLPGPAKIKTFLDVPTPEWPFAIEEKPLLLDPCEVTDFRKHFVAHPDGFLIASTKDAAATISHFTLNRDELVVERASAVAGYLAQLCEFVEQGEEPVWLFQFEKMSFGGIWYLILERLARELGNGGRRMNLTRKGIWKHYQANLPLRGFADQLRNAFERLQDLSPEQMSGKVQYFQERGDARPVSFWMENFKALERVEIRLSERSHPARSSSDARTVAPAIVILGENAAGKSSILEAMALVLARPEARRDLNLDTNRLILNPEWMGAERSTQRRSGKVGVRYEDGQEAVIALERGLPDKREPISARIPVFAYGAYRMFLKSDPDATAASSIRSLFDPSHVLPNPEKWLITLAGTPLFDEIVRNLRVILAADDIETIEVDRRSGQCFLVTALSHADGRRTLSRTPFTAVSSGFRAVLAMACDIMRGLTGNDDPYQASLAKARAVILIDEIEAHLHPRWKMRIVQAMREAFPEATFIVTTHDPLCLRGVRSDEVRVFRRLHNQDIAGDQLPSFVEQLDELPAVGALTIEQLLTSDLFQLHTTDSPELDSELARAGDVLAKARAAEGGSLGKEVEASVNQVRSALRSQIGRSLPIGSTEVERLIQEALEEYLIQRRNLPHRAMLQLRKSTRDSIVAALRISE